MKMIERKKKTNRIVGLVSRLRIGDRNEAFLHEMFGTLSTKKILGRFSVGLVIWLVAAGTLAAIAIPTMIAPYSGTVNVKQPTVTASVSPPTATWAGATISPGITQPLTDTIQMTITASLAACLHYTATITGPSGTPVTSTLVPGPATVAGFTIVATNQGVDINQVTTTGIGVGSRFITGTYPVVVTVTADGAVPDGAYSIVVNFEAVACA